MGTRPVNFLGRNYYEPGSFAAFRAQQQPPGPSDDLQTLIVIAAADNGVDGNDANLEDENRFYTFLDYQTAARVLRGGEGLEALQQAFAPSTSPDFPGPQFVKFININPNVAATANAANTEAGSTTLTAAVPGPAGNFIRFRKVLQDKEIYLANEDEEERSGSLDLPVFQIQYTGDATTAQLSVGSGSITVTLAGDQTDGSQDLAIDTGQFNTLAKMAEFVAQQTGYAISTEASTDFQLKYLDHFSGQDVKSNPYTAQADAFAEKVFLEGTGLLTVDLGATIAPLANMDAFAYLAGGATGVAGADAFADAIAFAERLTGLYRHLHSTALADQILFRDSLNRLNAPDGQNETFGSTGASTLDSLSARRQNARLLNNRYLCYGVTKTVNFDLDRNERIYGGVYLGLLHNALKAGSDPRISATWKPLNILRAAETHTRKERQDIIKDGGLAAGKVVRGGDGPINAILRSVTTEQASNLLYNEASAITVGLAAIKEIRTHLSIFIGEVPVDPAAFVQGPTEADLKSEFEKKMDSLVLRGWLRGSTLLGIPPWYQDDYKIQIDGDAFYFLDVRANPVLPLNFLFTLLNFEVISGTAASA